MFKTIIVDDEIKALDRMERLCHKIQDIELLERFSEAGRVIDYIRNHPVDLLLLDIEMPGISGIEIAEQIFEIAPQCEVIFVTAYDKYALQAFQVNAVGYLLKPIELEDLEGQIRRLRMKRQIPQKRKTEDVLSVQCIGGFQCKNETTGETLRWRTAKAEELFALLVHMNGQVITKDKVIDTLWPEMEYEKASKNLHAISYYIRESLSQLGFSDVFLRERGAYRLNDQQIKSDVKRFMDQESLLSKGSEVELKELLELDKGHYFEGKDYLWAAQMDAWLKNRFLTIRMALIKRLEEEGKEDEVISQLIHLIRNNLSCEEAYRKLIGIYLNQDNTAMAMQWYRTCEKNLREELDIEPSEELKQMMRST